VHIKEGAFRKAKELRRKREGRGDIQRQNGPRFGAIRPGAMGKAAWIPEDIGSRD
jgi:hypothetical protein